MLGSSPARRLACRRLRFDCADESRMLVTAASQPWLSGRRRQRRGVADRGQLAAAVGSRYYRCTIAAAAGRRSPYNRWCRFDAGPASASQKCRRLRGRPDDPFDCGRRRRRDSRRSGSYSSGCSLLVCRRCHRRVSAGVTAFRTAPGSRARRIIRCHVQAKSSGN